MSVLSPSHVTLYKDIVALQIPRDAIIQGTVPPEPYHVSDIRNPRGENRRFIHGMLEREVMIEQEVYNDKYEAQKRQQHHE